MDLFEDDKDREPRASERSEPRSVSRTRKTVRGAKKRRMTARKPAVRRRRRKVAGAIPSQTRPEAMPRPEPPPLIPQPTLDLEDEDVASDEGEQRQEPPPPSALADLSVPKGDDDDLFEYVF